MNGKRTALLAALLAVAVSFTACSSGSKGNSVKLQGAGASFPAPLYTSWFKTYGAAHLNVQVDYQSVGSAAGSRVS